jgi:hypothetical protein
MRNDTYIRNEDGTTTLILSEEVPDITNEFSGEVTLVAGKATVNTPRAGLAVVLTRMQTSLGNIGNLYIYTPATIDGVSFQIRSTNSADTGNVFWQIIED